MKKQLLTALAFAAATGIGQAQVYITTDLYGLYGVTNEGVAVGSPQDYNKPFYLWNVKTDDIVEIGGVSAGQGVGGKPRFSEDGKFVCGAMENENIKLNTDWRKVTYTDWADYRMKDINRRMAGSVVAVGCNEDNSEGLMLTSSNGGMTWKSCTVVYGDDYATIQPQGLLCCTSLDAYQMLAAGYDGRLYYSKNGSYWSVAKTIVDEVETMPKTIYAMNFVQGTKYGVLGVELEDGTYTVWYTDDQGDTFSTATGVEGQPTCFAYVNEVFYMTTNNGHVQMSIDNGATWTKVFSTDNEAPLYRIRFADENKAIAISDEVVYLTTNGCEEWTKTDVLPQINPFSTSTTTWNDADWHGDTITVVGNNGLAFTSVDNGKKFNKLNMNGVNGTEDYGVFMHEGTNVMALADGGNFYFHSELESTKGYCAGLYDVENDTWTPLETSGYMSGLAASSPFNISGDGHTVVGGVYTYNPSSNTTLYRAAAWEDGKLIDLGSMYAANNRSSRAEAASFDGSIIVGYQDIIGNWFAAIWKKNADGSYTEELLFKDPARKEENIDYTVEKLAAYDDLVGYCTAITSDGKWIGGTDEYTGSGTWLWNEEEGFVTISEDKGFVNDIFNDGTWAVGAVGTEAFIWTKEKGYTALMDYLTDELQCEDLDGFIPTSLQKISPNGRYLAGYGKIDNQRCGFVVDLDYNATAIDNKVLSQVKANVYPNPVADELHVALPFNANELATTLTLVDMQGRVVRTVNNASQDNVINVSDLTTGIYVLDVNAAGTHKSFKIVVKH